MKWQSKIEGYRIYLISNTKATAENSLKRYEKSVILMLRWINKNPKNITQKDVEKYNAYMRTIYKQNSIIAHSVAINHFFEYLNKDISIPVPSKVKVERTPLTEHEIEKIIECAKITSPIDYTLLLTMRDTIQREHSIRELDINDVNLAEKTIRFKRIKGGQPHIANISTRTVMALRDYMVNYRIRPNDDSKALFVMENGNRLSKGVLYKKIKQYGVMAGINKPVFPHIFRHSGITIMDKKGVSPKVIMAQSGHRDEKTVLGYIHPDRDHIRQEFDRTLGDNNHHPKIEQPEIPRTESTYQLTNETRETMLLDALITGRISEDTYRVALEQIKTCKSEREKLAYFG